MTSSLFYHSPSLFSGNPDPEPGEPNPILAHEALPDRLRIGNYKKERGNFWFGRGEYSLAIQCYRGATRFLDASDEELALADRAKNGKLVEQVRGLAVLESPKAHLKISISFF